MQNECTNLFEGQSIYTGIDVHKNSWKVTIMGEHYEHKTFSQDPDVERLTKYLKKHFPGAEHKMVYEAGFCGFKICRQFQAHGIACKVVHPADVPTSIKEKLQKTDKIDSRKLARSLRDRQLEFIHIPDTELESDRALIRQRFRMIKDSARTKNRVKSLLFQFGVEIPEDFSKQQTRSWSEVYINWLREIQTADDYFRLTLDNYIDIALDQRRHILKADSQVRALSRTDRYRELFDLITSVPGIGRVTGMTLLVQLGDISRFSNLDKLCNYVGLVPTMHGSGDNNQAGKMINRGRKELKIMIIEASWTAIRKDPVLMLKFNDLVAGGMNKNKAIIKIARKLLNRIRYVMRTKQPYEIGIVE